MNKNNFSSILQAGTIMVALLMTLTILLQSCDDDEASAPTSFSIDGNPAGLTSAAAGKTQSYVVRATGSWQIVAKEEGDWIKVFPSEGEDDGIFKITVGTNESFEERLMNFAFVVNGEEQPVLFRVEQDANTPYITLPAKVTIPAPGGNFDVAITANVAWTYTISDDAWLTEVSKTETNVTLNAAANSASSNRAVTMTVTAIDFPSLSQTVALEQLPGTIVLQEDFNWLAYGSAVPYTTTGETSIANWTAEQQGKGWTSSVNPISPTANDRPLYARQGFVKLGKTNYGGDIISPKLAAIAGTKNLKVTFKAVAYVSAAGTVIDSRVLVIEVLGAGTPSVGVIMVENVPNTQPQDNASVVNNVWADDRAFTFTITGATADTQIRFLGKAFDLRAETPTTNRIFMDDIKVEIIE
jgi:hypothetical protein